FLDSNFVFPELCAGLAVAGQWHTTYKNNSLYLPRHYLRQFHPKYTPKDQVEEQAQAAGFPDWTICFREMAEPHRNPDVPTVGPWVTKTPITNEQFVLERNPYYWAVDTEGRQLPYIDRIVMR